MIAPMFETDAQHFLAGSAGVETIALAVIARHFKRPPGKVKARADEQGVAGPPPVTSSGRRIIAVRIVELHDLAGDAVNKRTGGRLIRQWNRIDPATGIRQAGPGK